MADEKEKVEPKAPPQSPEEAAAKLLEEISGEMFEKTGGDVWRSGQPLRDDPTARASQEAADAAKAASEKEKPAEKPKSGVAAQETTSDWDEPLAGKWKNREAAEKGVHELVHYAKAALARADAAEEKLKGLGKTLNGNEKEESLSDPFDELEAVAMPREPLKKAIRAEAQNLINEMLKPVAERQKADAEIVKMFPEYSEKFDGLLEFLEKNPQVKQDVEYAEAQGQYLMARRYAWTLYAAQEQVKAQDGQVDKAKERAERVADTRPDAAIITPSKSEQRTIPKEPDWPSKERMEYLKNMAAGGHQDILWRETIGKLLDAQGFPK